MFLLLQATDPEGFAGIWKMATEGGALALLAVIIVVLLKLLPKMADRIADSHVAAIKHVTDAQIAASTALAEAQKKAVESFAVDARDARSMFRVEQEAGRAFTLSLVNAERATSDARAGRIERLLDVHAQELSTVGKGITQLLAQQQIRKD